ncbi:M12 family metallopeptidase [Sphaerothrix gracilis]|uniref:M12 family metallopeptidase n=1 Tax=Sphaerothrix gracilis TaxID=3151835 RepID=UPI0031FC492E
MRFRWSLGRVPFEIHDGDFPARSANRQTVEQAINFWNNNSVVQLIPRNGEAEHVVFRGHTSSCRTAVGRQRDGVAQLIRCNVSGTFHWGNVMHEIGHALGLYHEHQRSDRATFVNVTGTGVNYDIENDALLIGPYDCDSVMHYGNITGSISNQLGQCAGMGQRNHLSTGDLRAAEFMYGIRSSGFFVQSDFGTRGNFEVVTGASGNGIVHYYRDNDASGVPWHSGTTHFSDLGNVNDVSLIQGNFGNNLEIVARCGNQLVHCYREGGSNWQKGPTFATNAGGTPGFIQGRYGTRGNFEVVAPASGNGIVHYYRDNDASGVPWHNGGTHLTNLGDVDDVSLIQGNFGNNLEIVARCGNQLVHCYREEGSNWQKGPTFATNAGGTPGFIQGRYGTRGNFEVVAPASGNGIVHYYRDNDASGVPWHNGGTHLTNLGDVDDVSLIQGNFGNNLEIVARCGNQLVHCYRDRSNKWNEGPTFATNAGD